VDTIAFGVGVRKVSWPDGYKRRSIPVAFEHEAFASEQL
jgi:hypothetical protein